MRWLTKTISTGLIGLAVLATASMSATAERPIRFDRQGNPVPATATSFDCAKAHGFAETTICSVGPLASNDRSISEAYLRLLLHTPIDGRAAIRQEQRDWIRTRNACADRDCLAASLDARLRVLWSRLDTLDRRLRSNVSQVGQCETTRIDFIGPRLELEEGKAPDGAQVGFADGAWQVSYDRETQVLKSRLGDSVRICLVEIPEDCPPGDNRGRVYEVMNLRTKSSWRLPDAEHECGGG